MKIKKLIICLVLTLGLIIPMTNSINAEIYKNGCRWNKRVQTCMKCVPQSECYEIRRKTYNKKWQLIKYTLEKYPYDDPSKIVTYTYTKSGYLKTKQETKYSPSRYSEKFKPTIRKKSFYKKGKLTKIIFFKYNKRGALKSNKTYGNAYKTIRWCKKKGKKYKVTKEYKYKYTNKGKLKRIK